MTLSNCGQFNLAKRFWSMGKNHARSLESLEEFIIKSSEFESLLLRIFPLEKSHYPILIEALCHKSFVNEMSFELNSFERLEFLGDTFLNHLIASRLFKKYHSLSEGDLSKLKAHLVSTESFLEIARKLYLNDVVLVNLNQVNSPSEKIIVDCLESIFGALFMIDKQKAEFFFDRTVDEIPHFYDVKKLSLFDAKSKLQEWTMKEFKNLPVYRSREINGEFQVDLLINDELVFSESGPSKRKIEKQLAAKMMQEILRGHYVN